METIRWYSYAYMRTCLRLFSCSQLAALLFDVLQLSPSPSMFPGDGVPSEKAQSSKGNRKSSGSSVSRSTGAEALQALLRAARSNEGDSRNSQVAA